MKVKELIRQLMNVDREMEVYTEGVFGTALYTARSRVVEIAAHDHQRQWTIDTHLPTANPDLMKQYKHFKKVVVIGRL